MSLPRKPSRRALLKDAFAAATLLWPAGRAVTAMAAQPDSASPTTAPAEPIIDIHQHTHYSGRTDEQLINHQRRMGATLTFLLPAGTYVERAATHDGKSNGLAAKCGTNESCRSLAAAHPDEYRFFANDTPDLPTAAAEIKRYLKLGAIGIGEQKFNVECDGPEMQAIFEIADEFHVPVLMHFQHGMYNKGFERFGKVLDKYPKVNFIGHAQTFWTNIDKNPADPKVLYPKTKVTSGGLTDQYLSDHPNLLADMSAGSGLNALTRDEDHAHGFLDRHQDQLLFGSDCNDTAGRGPTCSGWMQIRAIRRMAPTKAIERKILYENARRVFRL